MAWDSILPPLFPKPSQTQAEVGRDYGISFRVFWGENREGGV